MPKHLKRAVGLPWQTSLGTAVLALGLAATAGIASAQDATASRRQGAA